MDGHHKSCRLRTLALLVVACLFGWPGPAAAYQIHIRDVHVTQGTQTVKWEAGNVHGFAPQAGNTLPLVARRSTAVRVLLDLQLAPGETAPSLNGSLMVKVDGQPRYAQPLPAINQPFTPLRVPDIQNENHTLNFEIPAPNFIAPFGSALQSHDVDFLVEVFEVGQSAPVATGSADDLTVMKLKEVQVAGVPVPWIPQPNAASVPPNQDLVRIGRGDAFLASALPIDDTCFRPQRCTFGPGPVAGVTHDPYRVLSGFNHADVDGSGTLGHGQGESGPLLEALVTWRNFCFSASGVFCPQLSIERLLFVYGWLPASARYDHNGVTLPGSNVGYGFDGIVQGQGTIAHELGHMLGLVVGGPGGHNPCPPANPSWPNCPEHDLSPNVGWDIGGRILNNPAGNGVTARVRGYDTHDLMNTGGGGALAQRWPNAATYRSLLEELQRRDPAYASATPLRYVTTQAVRQASVVPAALTIPSVRLMSLSGRVTEFSRLSEKDLVAKSASLSPAFFLPVGAGTERRIADNSGARQLMAEIVEQVDGITRTLHVPIDARMIVCWIRDEPEGDAFKAHQDEYFLGPFSALVPVTGGVLSVRLTDVSGERTYASMKRSRSAPAIKILSPKPHTVLRGATKVVWTATDKDSKPAELMYQVAYSADGGRTFALVAINVVNSRSITFDAAKFPRSDRSGVIRIYASDGLNNTTSEIRGLSNRAVEADERRPPDLRSD